MSNERMSIFGVGPIFVALSGLFTGAALYGRSLDPAFFTIPEVVPRWLQLGIGGLLLALGVPMFVWSLVILNEGFPAGRLFTDGPYGWCRHPVYCCWVVFNVPGIVLLVGTWLGLVVPVLMYVTLRLLVRAEERWLPETFGDEYVAYQKRTPAVFPRVRGWRRCEPDAHTAPTLGKPVSTQARQAVVLRRAVVRWTMRPHHEQRRQTSSAVAA